jgi:hypothetical protein
MSIEESVPIETSRLINGKVSQPKSEGTKAGFVVKWVQYVGILCSLVGLIVVLIQTGSQLFLGWSYSDRSYNIDFLPYFDDFNPGNGNMADRSISVAFIGNSMQYYNDLPRIMVEISEGDITQNSCYRPGTSLKTIVTHGNGMPNYWNTSAALINGTDLYDFGACTVKQLLFGKDTHLEKLALKKFKHNPVADNPCLAFPKYLDYLNNYYAENKPKWDFLVLSDNSRNAFRMTSREEGLHALRTIYVPLFRRSGAIPVFLDTHAYFDYTGETHDIPTFTSVTYEGYQQYAATLEPFLPSWQKPRIAPSGIVFLAVWEEDHGLWETLFHTDRAHASPLGTFLQACVIHYTLLGHLPLRRDVLRDDMSELWRDAHARMMTPPWQPINAFPSKKDAESVYNIAERVLINKHLPDAFFIREDMKQK